MAESAVLEPDVDDVEQPKKRRTRKKATKKKAAPKQSAKKAPARSDADELNLLVDFLGVSIGDGTGRVGVKISRNQLSLGKADRTLCGRRLTGKITLVTNGEDVDQALLFEGARQEVNATFDVKRFGVAPDWISCGLTFPLLEIDCRELAAFAKKQGRLIVDEIELIPSRHPDDDE